MIGLKTLVVLLAILVVAAVFLSPGGMDKATGFFDSIRTWLGESVGTITTPPAIAASKDVAFSLSPNLPFTLNADSPVNVSSSTIHINGFKGKIIVDASNISLEETNTNLDLQVPSAGIVLDGYRLASLELDNTGFTLPPNITAISGNITITGFIGNITLDAGTLRFAGKVGRIKAMVDSVSMEI